MIITLTGSNDYLIRQTLKAMVEQFVNTFGAHGVERVSGEEFEPIRLGELLQGVSLFSAERLIILAHAAANRPLWEALGEWLERIPAETTLVIVEGMPDKRTKTYKQLLKHSDVREFGEGSEHELIRWLQECARTAGGELETKVAAYLISQVGTDQWRLSHELQKLIHYQPQISREAIDQLVDAVPQATAFELLDAAMGRHPDTVSRLIGKLAAAEDPYKFFGLLTSQVQALAAIKSAGTRAPEVIAKDCGIHPFVVRKTQSIARTTHDAELKLIVAHIAQCDLQLKSTGADPWLLLEQCLSKVAART